tara:strand:- start:343 stop:936 length:594 start_codon:yes stop_codon:yes gene_type:complete
MPITINGNGTITGLSVGGLPDGTVDADTLANGAASGSKITMPTGTVVQVVQGTFTGTNNTTGTGLVDTGITKSITVTGSNKVLVSYTCYMSAAAGVYGVRTVLVRGSSQIFLGDQPSTGLRATGGGWTNNSLGDYTTWNHSNTFLDTPGAGTHTYKIQFSSTYTGSNQARVGRPIGGTSNSAYYTTPSHITLMEIAA